MSDNQVKTDPRLTGWDHNFIPILRKSIGALLVFQLTMLLTVFIIHYQVGDLFLHRMIPGVILILNLSYLFFPVMQRVMGRWYIPGFIVLLTMGPYLALQLIIQFENVDSAFFEFAANSRGFPLQVAALIVTAWFYRLKAAFLYALITVIMDFSMNFIINQQLGESTSFFLSNIDIRMGTFIISGFLISKIAEHVDNNARELMDANSRLVHYSDTLEDLAVNRERSRMARELHDTLAHSLTALTIQLEATKVLMDRKPEQAAMSLQNALDTARSGLKETRSVLSALRPSALENRSLMQAIKGLTDSIPESINSQINMPELLPILSDQTEHCIFRIMQEAVHNAVKHSGADQIDIEIELQNDLLEFSVTDNGQGFDTKHHFQGYGLLGMQERAALLGATLNLSSQLSQGTNLQLSLNLNAGGNE